MRPPVLSEQPSTPQPVLAPLSTAAQLLREQLRGSRISGMGLEHRFPLSTVPLSLPQPPRHPSALGEPSPGPPGHWESLPGLLQWCWLCASVASSHRLLPHSEPGSSRYLSPSPPAQHSTNQRRRRRRGLRSGPQPLGHGEWQVAPPPSPIWATLPQGVELGEGLIPCPASKGEFQEKQLADAGSKF